MKKIIFFSMYAVVSLSVTASAQDLSTEAFKTLQSTGIKSYWCILRFGTTGGSDDSSDSTSSSRTISAFGLDERDALRSCLNKINAEPYYLGGKPNIEATHPQLNNGRRVRVLEISVEPLKWNVVE